MPYQKYGKKKKTISVTHGTSYPVEVLQLEIMNHEPSSVDIHIFYLLYQFVDLKLRHGTKYAAGFAVEF